MPGIPVPSALHTAERVLAQSGRALFAEITTKCVRRGAVTSVSDLEAAIHDDLECLNADPKPFVWTKSAEAMLNKEARAVAKLRTIKCGNQAFELEH